MNNNTTKNNEIVSFEYKNLSVRVIQDESGEPWFVATDIAKALGYREAKDMTRRLEADEKGRRLLPTLGGEQELNVINEPGLYNAILGSKLPTAKDFKRWVTHEVLPAIRKIDCLPCVIFASIRSNDERERKADFRSQTSYRGYVSGTGSYGANRRGATDSFAECHRSGRERVRIGSKIKHFSSGYLQRSGGLVSKKHKYLDNAGLHPVLSKLSLRVTPFYENKNAVQSINNHKETLNGNHINSSALILSECSTNYTTLEVAA